MNRTSSNSPTWRAALRRALRTKLGGGTRGDVRLDLGQAVDIAIRNGADRRLREAAPEAAISNMLRLMAEPGQSRSDPAE